MRHAANKFTFQPIAAHFAQLVHDDRDLHDRHQYRQGGWVTEWSARHCRIIGDQFIDFYGERLAFIFLDERWDILESFNGNGKSGRCHCL